MDSIKVLMVDDESRMRKLVKDFLTREGYMVLEAGDGEQALDIFMNDKNISLVILDVMMPKMDGWETLKEIRKFSQVPVIMLTAKADERDELQGFDLGVDLIVDGLVGGIADDEFHGSHSCSYCTFTVYTVCTDCQEGNAGSRKNFCGPWG